MHTSGSLFGFVGTISAGRFCGRRSVGGFHDGFRGHSAAIEARLVRQDKFHVLLLQCVGRVGVGRDDAHDGGHLLPPLRPVHFDIAPARLDDLVELIQIEGHFGDDGNVDDGHAVFLAALDDVVQHGPPIRLVAHLIHQGQFFHGGFLHNQQTALKFEKKDSVFCLSICKEHDFLKKLK